MSGWEEDDEVAGRWMRSGTKEDDEGSVVGRRMVRSG